MCVHIIYMLWLQESWTNIFNKENFIYIYIYIISLPHDTTALQEFACTRRQCCGTYNHTTGIVQC